MPVSLKITMPDHRPVELSLPGEITLAEALTHATCPGRGADHRPHHANGDAYPRGGSGMLDQRLTLDQLHAQSALDIILR